MLVLYDGKEVAFALVEVLHERMGNMLLISQSQSHSLSLMVLCIGDDGCCGCHGQRGQSQSQSQSEARSCFCGCGQPYGLPSIICRVLLYLSLSLSILLQRFSLSILSRQYYTYRLLSLTTDRRSCLVKENVAAEVESS